MVKASPVQPLEYFCCGCSLDLGVWVILTVHLLFTVMYITSTVSNIVLDSPTVGANVSPATQAFNCGFALATLPFILSGMSGVKFGHETHLRIYLGWLLLTFGMDTVFVTWDIAQSGCANVPGFLMRTGAAFACGITRIIGGLTLLMYLSFMAYAAFTVWSRCLELQLCGSADSLEKLYAQGVIDVNYLPPQHREGLFGVGPTPSQPLPVVYGSLATPIFAGGTTIFDGRAHDVNFPPAAARKSA